MRIVALIIASTIPAFGQGFTFSDLPFLSFSTASGAAYEWSENGEGTGTPSGWTDVIPLGTLDWDYTSAPAPLEGAQSLYTSHGAGTTTWTYHLVDDLDNVWFYCLFRSVGTLEHVAPIMIRDLGANTLFMLRQQAGPELVLIHGTITATNATPLSADTTYHLWLNFQNETGGSGNGVGKLYISTTATKPGSPDVNITTGTADAAAGYIYVGLNSTGAGSLLFDKLRLAYTEIGSNPP